MIRSFLVLAAALACLTPATAFAQVKPPSPERCAALKGGRWADLDGAPTWVTGVIHRPASKTRRAVCEVEGYVNPAVGFGLYLPAEGWNGKYLVKGCGASCGVVAPQIYCAKALHDGYACLQTDMGHRSTTLDNNWTAGNLQGLVDYGYRATHVTTVAGKAILAAYYGAPAARSYFMGCSTGGRQALVEAQRFPEDFDGIVAISPGNVTPPGVAVPAYPDVFNLGPDGKAILGDVAARLVHDAVLADCDLNDGVRDGVLDARDCRFDPARLRCKAGPAADCLTSAQVAATRTFYANGFLPGSELNWLGSWTADPPRSAYAMTQGRGDPAIVDVMNYAGGLDLRGFQAHGAKLILVHGQSDTSALPPPVVDYFEAATRAMGGTQTAGAFMRFFVVPGMNHCTGGAGAWSIDYLSALDDWSTNGVAPARLIGVRPNPGVAMAYASIDSTPLRPDQIAFSRPYFPYPQKAYYSGHGDPDEASSFRAGLSPP